MKFRFWFGGNTRRRKTKAPPPENACAQVEHASAPVEEPASTASAADERVVAAAAQPADERTDAARKEAKEAVAQVAVVTERVPLDVPVRTYATGWNTALARGIDCRVRSFDPTNVNVRAIAVAVPRVPIKTQSWYFAVEGEPDPSAREEAKPHADRPAGKKLAVSQQELLKLLARSRTRVKPPRDVVRLEDRLHYLLQPSLESILIERQLEFPFLPFPYQMEGIAFLFARHAAILADEMGLGKTMQAITSIRLLVRSGEIRHVLLVCPKPLVTNWKREFDLWAPEIPVVIVEGDRARREYLWRLANIPVKIANYELLHRDHDILLGDDSAPSSLRVVGEDGESHAPAAASAPEFDLVVLDESQRIKNRTSATSKIVHRIRRRRSWALTGTPVENSTEDLVGIFEFLAPGYLSPELKPQRMGETVSDFVLRRTKDQVLTDLPPKLWRDAEVELTPEQRETYDRAQTEGVIRLNDMGRELTIQHVFELVLRLKQICNFDPVTGASAKLERLEADLEEVAQSGRKAIVFSQWVKTLDEIERRLARFHPLAYHGRIPSHKRDDVIRRFRDDPKHSVLLMSYGAGSVGLNLQFCGYVFLFDRWWNPAVEDQAINRAHRIGAAGPVTVTRFLAVNTIEERINLVLEEKRELFETIFSGHRGPTKMGLTQEEIFGLFDLRCPAAA
ncbi:MAG: DEAD/DEAH box helicase [Planctomycetota bacterium]|nr:MAG: DEAD/DEAH box helicase [Planctomycetota bacterium]